MQQIPRENRFKLPEYLGMAEVNALISAAPTLSIYAMTLRISPWLWFSPHFPYG